MFAWAAGFDPTIATSLETAYISLNVIPVSVSVNMCAFKNENF